tara:strand:+ start:3189 stop:3545 length:357 start_codon:yes stop_codon:yes gene_type:complete
MKAIITAKQNNKVTGRIISYEELILKKFDIFEINGSLNASSGFVNTFKKGITAPSEINSDIAANGMKIKTIINCLFLRFDIKNHNSIKVGNTDFKFPFSDLLFFERFILFKVNRNFSL